MIFASVYHISKKEYKAVAFNAVLFILSGFVLYSRS
jgi:hypothetical protein